MLEKRFGKTLFAFDFSFFAVTAIGFIFHHKVAYLLALSVILHELAHIFLIIFFRKKVTKIHISGIGVKIQIKKSPHEIDFREAMSYAVISLFAPIINLIFALIFWNYSPIFACCNIFMGAFNLFPSHCLDGGTFLSTFFYFLFPLKNMQILLKIMCLLTLPLILAFLMHMHIFNIWIIYALAYATIDTFLV